MQLGLELYFEAFTDLSSCRPSGWGVMPIPWTAIREWGRAYELTAEELDDLTFLVRQMDKAYMDYYEKKAAKKRKR